MVQHSSDWPVIRGIAESANTRRLLLLLLLLRSPPLLLPAQKLVCLSRTLYRLLKHHLGMPAAATTTAIQQKRKRKQEKKEKEKKRGLGGGICGQNKFMVQSFQMRRER